MEGNGGMGVMEEQEQQRSSEHSSDYISYVLALFHMRFLNDKYRLSDLSVN